jgi:very-short-patch-repair endonuclease
MSKKKDSRSANSTITKYGDFEVLWEKLSSYPLEKEHRFAKEIVGDGPKFRERLKFAGLQDWRLDYAIPDLKIYLEVQGAGWGHQGNQGFLRDMRKHNALTLNGWLGLYFPAGTVKSSANFVAEQLQNLVKIREQALTI